MSTEIINKNRNKRKRKKTFMNNAVKYAKKGCYGRGSQVDPETYQFMLNTLEAYNAGFESEEEKASFVFGAFKTFDDKEIECCRNQLGSRVFEILLPMADISVLRKLMTGFGEDLRPLCSDKFATHVLEALLRRVNDISFDENFDENVREECKNFCIKVSKFLINNLEDCIWDTYANHVLRTCILCLCRMPKDDPKKREFTKASVSEEVNNIPDDYREIVQDCGNRLLMWPQFNELCFSEITSGFLQVLLKALYKVDPKLGKKYVKKLLTENFAPDNNEAEIDPEIIPKVFFSAPNCAILETCLSIVNSKLFTQIYAGCFIRRLAKLARTRNTNFAVRNLILHCNETTEFEAIFDELVDHFKEIISEGHSGIILALGQTCKRLSARQGVFSQTLIKSLGCAEPEDRLASLVLCLAKFKHYDDLTSKDTENLQKDKLNLHGTLLLQVLLEFNKPIKIVNSILNMNTKDLKNLFSNTMGSHIVDSYMTSQYVGEKSREKLIKKLKGCYHEFASTKYGSRSFDTIWKAAHINLKYSIIEELSVKDGAWSHSEYGKIIAYNINLAKFKKNKKSWKSSLTIAANKTDVEEVFADVFK